MPRTTAALIAISALVAVVLWLLATAVEYGLREPAPDPPAAVPEAAEEPDRQNAEPARSGAEICQETENRLVQVVADSRYCVSDDDCTLFDYGYPIDCLTSVAKSRISLLREEYRKYDEHCEFRVFFDCPTEPYVRLPVCRGNRCAVELDSIRPPETARSGHSLE